MYRINKYIFFCFLFFTFLKLEAQTQKQIIHTANHYYERGDFYGAAQNYKQAIKNDEKNIDLLHKYASSLRQYNEYKKALKYYQKLYLLDKGKTYPLDVFHLAEMYRYTANYTKASFYFKKSSNLLTDKKGLYIYNKIQQEIISCEYAEIYKDSVQDLSVSNIGEEVNTVDAEFAPRLLNDSVLLFSSLKNVSSTDTTDSSAFFVKIFYAKRQGERWKTKGVFEENLSIKDKDIANVSISPKGNYLYFSICDSTRHCEIWRSEKEENNSWTAPKRISMINNTKYNSTQPFPSIINGKDILFFASDRPGGKGKMDIWYSLIDSSGKIGQPVNAGDSINSPGNEITPFYSNITNILYFSSDWWKGFGGFDVFRSKGSPENFQKAKNILPPINTAVNDLYFAIYPKYIFLVSNRTGSMADKGPNCCNDIYWAPLAWDSAKVIEEKDSTKNIKKLADYLPLPLYFDNDYPNPNSWDTTTQLTYSQTYLNYIKQKEVYEEKHNIGISEKDKKEATAKIDSFFTERVEVGLHKLQTFTTLLIQELQNGKSVQITIKGYASPLAKSDYNVNLSSRRIVSLVNYFKAYKDGKILPYINGTAENGARLTFKEIPFGEEKANKKVSDNPKDLRKSVYSIKAAMERRIEIISVQD